MLESKLGIWIVEPSGELKGKVPVAGRAYAIEGLETDTEYEILATIRVVKGTTASIIVFNTVSDSDERYIELILDAENDIVKLDRVDGAARETIKEVTYTIDPNKQYECQVIAKTDSADKGYVVASINGVVIINETDLLDIYIAGKHGFACEGTTDDYAQFHKRFFQSRTYYTTIGVLIDELRSIKYTELVGEDGTLQHYYDKLETYIKQCSRFIDTETERELNFFQHKGVTITELHDGVGATTPLGMYEFSEDQTTWEDMVGTIFTKQRPILTITSIHRNTAPIGDTDVWVEITKFRPSTYGEITFATIPPKGKKNIRIIYQAGYSTTPLDVQMACTRLIVNLIHKQVSDKTAAFISFQRPSAINFAMPDVFTPDIKAVLKRYRLLGFGEM